MAKKDFVLREYPVITDEVLSRAGIDTGDGITLYRGVLVFWDNDRDPRVLTFIDDNIEDICMGKLIAVQERKGMLSMIWQDHVPPALKQEGTADGDGDCWFINYSATLSDDED